MNFLQKNHFFPNMNSKFWDHALIFFVSFASIALELFFTRVLNLKTFNHVVYVIIPFALLGYGIGAQLYLLTMERSRRWPKNQVLGVALVLLGALILISYSVISQMFVSVTFLQDLFKNASNGLALSAAYLVFMVPFIVIGYIVLYLFSQDSADSPVLYFWDLIGAGIGAAGFFWMIYTFEVTGSFVAVAVLSGGLGLMYLWQSKTVPLAVATLALTVLFAVLVPEKFDYRSDGKGWENFPNYYKPNEYEVVSSRWHPLGRTDAYRLNTRNLQERLYFRAGGTFQINLQPPPEYTYLSTNFLGGTPVYHMNPEGRAEFGSRELRFSQAMEFPYLLNSRPRVIVIGAGGGRDIYHALSHGAVEVRAAEINPEIYRLMMPGGELHEYSGGIYTRENTWVENVDGRYLAKKLKNGGYDLIVLNGVDTYSGLSSGAYTFAESYLYTRNAVEDYLDALGDNGMMNFNRWFFKDAPRETLRLFAIILEAMRQKGIESPWEHVVVGEHNGWGMLLAKKSPFAPVEYQILQKYFSERETELIYPSPALLSGKSEEMNWFDRYAMFFRDGRDEEFRQNYMFDVSVITDDNPFFYKYYRFRDVHPQRLTRFSNYGAGLLVFVTPALVLFNAFLFSILFILLPQWVLKRDQLKKVPGGSPLAFVMYYICLGVGFMFVQIPLMQKFSLLLASPIYAISVILAATLIFSGLGSLSLVPLQARFRDRRRLLVNITILLTLLIAAFLVCYPLISSALIGLPFWVRAAAVVLIVAPIGLCLGIYFPSGMQLITRDVRGAMSWAWGINAGFSVIGSMVAVVLAQFVGFRFVLLVALAIYWVAAFCYMKMFK